MFVFTNYRNFSFWRNFNNSLRSEFKCKVATHVLLRLNSDFTAKSHTDLMANAETKAVRACIHTLAFCVTGPKVGLEQIIHIILTHSDTIILNSHCYHNRTLVLNCFVDNDFNFVSSERKFDGVTYQV